LAPQLEPSASLLFVDDPFRAEDWTLPVLLYLRYGDRILVDRTKTLQLQGLKPNPSDYDYSFGYRLGAFEMARQPLPAATPAAQVRIVPSQIKPGDAFSVSVKELPGQTVSLAYQWLTDHVAKRGVLQSWCTLDNRGTCALAAPKDQALGKIVVTHVRSQSGHWMPAQGSLEIAR
jgi:hypothetical protein